jgi:HEAT repeat protein
VQRRLLRELAQGKSRGRPWAALGLGLQGHALIEGGRAPSTDVVRALRRELRDTSSPELAGALAVALGLTRGLQAEPELLARLERGGIEELRGHMAVALGLMRSRGVLERLDELRADSTRRPVLLRSLAIALGLLGDPAVSSELVALLRTTRSGRVRAASAIALGHVGDARAVDPLLALLRDAELSASVRLDAAVALGHLVEPDELPWTARFATGVNYPHLPVTLHGDTAPGLLSLR